MFNDDYWQSVGLRLVAAMGLGVIWFSLFPFDADYEFIDVVIEGGYLAGALVTLLLVFRLEIRVLDVGWSIFTTGLYIDFLDELTSDPDLLSTQIEGILTAGGLLLIGFGIYQTIQRYRDRQQTLQQQNAQLDRFASVISHDLRNPLGIAETYLDFARESGEDDDFETVADAHDRMDAMIDDLLTMARAGTTVEDTEPVELSELIEEAWKTTKTEGASLDADIADGRTIDADRSLLQSVFENLFRNAVDHNEPPITVRVGIDRDIIYVEDTGSGIPEDDREQVFDHGYTTGDDTTGLGLSIVRDIIAAHGWEVRVTNGLDGGARFGIIGANLND